jgi:cytochrome P450
LSGLAAQPAATQNLLIVCLGALLAHLEGQITIGTLLQRFPNLCLACEPEQLQWNPSPYLRSLKALPVVF